PASPASHPVGFIHISGSDVPLHEKLLLALPRERAQPFVRSLQAQGTIDFDFKAAWKEASQPRAEVTQEIRLKDCQIQYAPFRYPLQHVQGLVTAQNEHWALRDIVGRGASDGTTVKCGGEATPNGVGVDVDLQFEARDVPLDDTLKNA